MCVIIMRFSIDSLMKIFFLLTLVCEQVRLLGQLEKCTPEAGEDIVFCSRTLQQNKYFAQT